LPSGVTTGMFVVYKGAKCAQEVNPHLEVKDLPCGRPADHDSGFYQWGIPTDPTNDEAALSRDGDDHRVFASADDHWRISDQVNRALLENVSDAELLKRADTLLAESTVSRISEDGAAMYLNEYDHRYPNNENAHAKKTAERLVAVRQTRELAEKDAALMDTKSTRIKAQVMCRFTVKENLKAPSSADFQSYRDDYIQYMGKGKFEVRTRADAVNSFGAKLRSTFTCEVQCSSPGECIVSKLDEM